MNFKCSCCGQVHDSVPHVGADAPDHYLALSEEERSTRTLLTSDTCIIDGRDFFVRGIIEIPVLGAEEIFGWGVWVSLKEENFERYLTTFDGDDWPAMGPFFGWLCTNIGFYGKETLHMKTNVNIRKEGLRPKIEPHQTRHPLLTDLRKGLSLAKVSKIAHYYEVFGAEASN